MVKAQRIFDVDWGQVSLSVSRPAAAPSPTVITWSNLTDNETLLHDDQLGNVVYFQTIDLEQLTMDGRSFNPLAIEVQRPWTAPLGSDINFLPSNRHYEYLYIFTAPLPNQEIIVNGDLQAFKDLGLDTSIAGLGTSLWRGQQIPDAAQCVFAQSTISVNPIANAASVWNGTLIAADPAGVPPVIGDPFAPLMAAEMQVTEVNRWGSLPAILGPKLFCYRFMSYPSQALTGLVGIDNPILLGQGITLRNMSPLSIKIICEEANLSESEYLVSAANAYNNANYDDPNES
jgi:hypothetical protein